jgi:hypothetical protein
MVSYNLRKSTITDRDAVHKKDLFLGLMLGLTLTMGGMFVWDMVELVVYNTPNEIVCQNGKAFESVEYGSSVYLKTGTECLDTRLTEGENNGIS